MGSHAQMQELMDDDEVLKVFILIHKVERNVTSPSGEQQPHLSVSALN